MDVITSTFRDFHFDKQAFLYPCCILTKCCLDVTKLETFGPCGKGSTSNI